MSKPPAPAFFRWLTYLLLLPLIAASTTFFGCISLVCGLWDKSGRQQHFIAHLWARTLLILSLSPITLVGEEKLRIHQTAVYAMTFPGYLHAEGWGHSHAKVAVPKAYQRGFSS